MPSYIMLIKGSIKGTVVDSWHELTDDEKETKATLLAFFLRRKANMSVGPLKVTFDAPVNSNLFQRYLRTLSQEKLDAFIKDATV